MALQVVLRETGKW